MLPDTQLRPITRNNLNEYLKDLGKEFRRLNGAKAEAEVVLVGGAAVLAKYDFRDLTYDVDAIIETSISMKDAISRVRDKHELPHGWLNTNFMRTESYSAKLREVSVFYRTFSNILHIRTVTAEYLLAMKLKSARQYKSDLSDIVGVMWEHQKHGKPLKREAIETAFLTLYGVDSVIPETSSKLLDAIFSEESLEELFKHTRESELESKELLLEFERKYPKILKNENIGSIIENMRQKHETASTKKYLLGKLEKAKREVDQN
ncbi:MAG: DUF6036 family nucleotidyltransferase [Oscillospiraceae bacterium]|nr:DUF6036 family nucleotidyltransferase [Oscillospiraceae bacterium]